MACKHSRKWLRRVGSKARSDVLRKLPLYVSRQRRWKEPAPSPERLAAVLADYNAWVTHRAVRRRHPRPSQ